MLLSSIWSGGCIIYQSLNKNTSVQQLPLFPGLPTVHAVSLMVREIAIKNCTVRELSNLAYLLLRWSNRGEFLEVGRRRGGESAASYHRKLANLLAKK